MHNVMKKMDDFMFEYNQFSKSVRNQVYVLGKFKLFPSEIQVLIVINKNNDYNLTDISKELNITKGALSKTIVKLTNKGLLNKYKKDENAKSVYYNLTEEGNKACLIHDEVHKNFDISPNEAFSDFCLNNELILSEFIDYYTAYIKHLDEILKKKPWEE